MAEKRNNNNNNNKISENNRITIAVTIVVYQIRRSGRRTYQMNYFTVQTTEGNVAKMKKKENKQTNTQIQD